MVVEGDVERATWENKQMGNGRGYEMIG